MNSPVQKIKERLSIEDLVSSYIKLERAGANLKARCPFHSEKSASFFISPERGGYYCFGCGAKGDIFTFVQEFEGLDFRGALKLLSEKAGIPLESYSPQDQKNQSEKERLYDVMEEATKFFEKNLKENKNVEEYLKSRGLEEKTIKDFRIGFALLDWRTLYDYLKNKNFTDREIELAGLAKHPDDKTKGMYDRFRGRVMFPISDSSGRVIAFSGRILVDDEKSAKYLNSPETPIFHKSSILYGVDKAKQSIRKNDFSIVVEGQFDLILSHQAGFKNTVATSGTSLIDSEKSEDNTINSLGMISHLSENIVFVFDSDKAGLAASERATPIGFALFKDMNVKAASMPLGVDPADLISKKGVDAWREVIRGSKHIIEFLVDRYISTIEQKDSLQIKLNIQKKVIPYLQLIQNPIKKSHFISYLSSKSGIKEEDIRDILNKTHQPDLVKEYNVAENKSNIFRKDHIERRLLGIAFWQEEKKDKSIDPELIFKKLEKAKELYKDVKEDLIFEAEAFYSNNQDLEKDTKEMLSSIEEEYLNEELSQRMHELQNIKDKDKEIEILKQINDINKKKEDIKNSRQK
ncbi:MAG: DNA primase [Candidatus Nomurabacteria bacterium]|nr:DNA primase [Candidatus Nomurabacteria bacterium]